MEQKQSEAGSFRDPLETEQDTSPLVSCFWCERLHPGEHALSVCPTCAARYSTMRALEMSGAYPLSGEAIDGALRRTSPGNYALGYMEGETFSVFFVGRSDSDVRRRLHEWVGAPSQCHRYAPSSKAAWELRSGPCMPLGVPAPGRVGIDVHSGYTHFAYSYARSAEAAFGQEWRNFEDFGGRDRLDNDCHPMPTPRCSGEYLPHGNESRTSWSGPTPGASDEAA